jgi:hypothetical protein
MMTTEDKDALIKELESQLDRETKAAQSLRNYARRAKRLICRDVAAIKGRAADAHEERGAVSTDHPLWLELDTEAKALRWAVMLLEESLSRVAFAER